MSDKDETELKDNGGPLAQISETDLTTLNELKVQKAVAKSALTKAKNKLLKLIALEFPSHADIRDQIDKVSTLQASAIETISNLAESYRVVGDLVKFKSTSEEIDTVEEASDIALQKADALIHATLSEDDVSSTVASSRASKSSKASQRTSEKAKLGSERTPLLSKTVANSKKLADSSHVDQKSNTYDIGNDMWKQLKRVSIPVFSGDIKEYESWKAAFMACVDKAPATNEYKLLQLRQYLNGEASQLISRLGHTSTSYDVALNKLDRKYGGKRRQIALQIEEIKNFKPIRPDNAKDLDMFTDMLDVAVVNLKDNDKVEELGDGCLYSLLLAKLTEPMIKQFERWVFEMDRQESVETLREWVLQESKFQTIAHESKHGLSEKQKHQDKGRSGSFFGGVEKHISPKCNVCRSERHTTDTCPQLVSLDTTDRWDKVRQLSLCYRCLGRGHVGKFCTQRTVCGVNGCSNTHSPVLHTVQKRYQNDKKDRVKNGKSEDRSSRQVTMSTTKVQAHIAALRTIPVMLKHGDRRIRVNALLDDASSQTYVNEDVVSELGLTGTPQRLSVSVLNNNTETFDSSVVDVGLESIDGSVDTMLTVMTTRKVTGRMPVLDWQQYQHRWKHLEGIPFQEPSSPPIVDILIGMDYLDLHCSLDEICGGPGDPIARLTPLGWTCVGLVRGVNTDSHSEQSFYAMSSDGALEEIVQQFWNLDDVSPLKCPFTDEEKKVIDAVDSTIEYSNNRYTVGIPWKAESSSQPETFKMAFTRLEHTEKKLSKDTQVSEAYAEAIHQYVEKGYIRKVPHAEQEQTKWYLPHFPVVKMSRDTTKVRIVFDASAKVKGVSLNDIIHQGPKLQNDLFSILVRFRKHPIAVICDIAEMYLQIQIAECDRPFFRFLWRTDPSAPPDVYELSRLVFGVNASPFLAQHISQEHARLHQDDLPLAAETVLESTYMDDNMTSVETEDEASELYKQIKQLWSSAGMNARKWISNSLDLIAEIPIEDRLKEFNIQVSELPSVKALGLMWDAESDAFRFIKTTVEDDVLSKRSFLRKMARVFDPLGLIAPFTVRAKVILQEIWLSGVGWDEPVSSDLQEKVSQWLQEIEHFEMLYFPRALGYTHDKQNVMLHVFSDASEQAYGAVIYCVVTAVDGSMVSQIVAAKSRVAPLKTVSIPRLELVAAVLAVKLASVVAESLRYDPHSLTYWTDSQDVLWWVKSQSRSYKPFVANRIGNIQEKSNTSQWRYVPSSKNPADVISRGSGVSRLTEPFWKSGPDFLLLDQKEWPDQKPFTGFDTTELKRQKVSVKHTLVSQRSGDSGTETSRLDPSNFSDWTRLCRVFAWISRFVSNVRSSRSQREFGELKVDEIGDAETHMLIETQKTCFPEEYLALSQNRDMAKASKLLNLQPFVDSSGLMRARGRLKFAHLANDARCPIILPKDSSVTRLIVKHFHQKVCHMGTNMTLSALSSKYWIVAAREAIRSWERECAWCRRQKAKAASQRMGDLPEFRVKTTARAFEKLGVDFAGPFLTVQGRGKVRRKRYLCLFTCLVTRAVHLEMAYGLDADSFLNAFFRMAHRRGVPKEVLSDNGTNFVAAAKELKHLSDTTVPAALASKGVVWKLNPPYAPHFGGVFESLIKSAKRAIVAILGSSDVTDEELSTAFTGAEALMNSRPLTYQSAHPNDIVPLTPNHFLHGQCGGEFAPSIDESHNPRKRWRRIQELLRHFWQRWLREWLPTLNARKKWLGASRDFRVGDIVIVVDPNSPRGSWPLGKIIKTHPGKDKLVRVVDLQIGHQTLTRPITKVCPLEWNAES